MKYVKRRALGKEDEEMTSVRPSDRTFSLVVKLIVYGALTAACMYMVYWFSAQQGSDSSDLSTKVAKVIAAIVYVGFDTFGAAEKLEILQGMSFSVRKAAHMTEFALLGGCMTATLWQLAQLISKERATVSTAALLGFILTVAYAASDEYHQLSVVGRAGQFTDVLIDSAGALIGILVVSLFLWLGAQAWRRSL